MIQQRLVNILIYGRAYTHSKDPISRTIRCFLHVLRQVHPSLHLTVVHGSSPWDVVSRCCKLLVDPRESMALRIHL